MMLSGSILLLPCTYDDDDMLLSRCFDDNDNNIRQTDGRDMILIWVHSEVWHKYWPSNMNRIILVFYRVTTPPINNQSPTR